MMLVNDLDEVCCFPPSLEAVGCICMKVSGSRDGVDAGRKKESNSVFLVNEIMG